MKFKAIVFDMDGVLVDSERFHSKVLDNFFVESGIDASHLTPKDFVGSVLKDMWPKVLRDEFTEARAAQVHQDFLDYDAQFPIPYKELLLPGVTDALKTFSEKGYKMAVASSSRRHEIAEVLDTHDLRQYFEFFLSGQDEFEQSKPNPAIYLAAMEKLGVEPSETLIIEDSHYGIMAGRRLEPLFGRLRITISVLIKSKQTVLLRHLRMPKICWRNQNKGKNFCF